MLDYFFSNPELQKFFLVFIRLSGLVVFAPPFLNARLTLQLKGGLVFFLALAMYPTVAPAPLVLPPTLPDLALAVGYEMTVGMIIGFAVQIMFMAFQMVGAVIDMHIGFAMASLIDPQTDQSVTVLGSLFMNLGLYFFLCLDGHLWLLNTFAGSFFSLPLMGMNLNSGGLVYHMSELFLRSFTFGIELAFPVIILMLMVQVALGFISRTVPQLQVFAVGFIFTTMLGVLSLRLLLLNIEPISAEFIDWFERNIWFLVKNLANG